MLTIQPKIQVANHQKLSFKGVDNLENDRAFYEEKQDYFEQQARDFEELENDRHTPKALKPVMKGLKILSEAVVEGFAVLWATKKGASFIKSGATKLASSKFTTGSKKVLKPLKTGFKDFANSLFKTISEKMEKLSNNETVKNITTKFDKLYKRFSESAIGKPIVKVAKSIISFGQKTFEKVSKLFGGKGEKVSAEKVYDKTVNAVANVAGVGSGVAGAYAAAVSGSKDDADADIEANVDDDNIVEDEDEQ